MQKIALVSDHLGLTGIGGAEKVAQVLMRAFPELKLYATVYNRHGLPADLQDVPIQTSFLQGLPGAKTHLAYYLPLIPKAAASLDLTGFDKVISFHHLGAKAVQVPSGAYHLCYCHTPARYLWDQYDVYTRRWPTLASSLVSKSLAPLRQWDVDTASRVNAFWANSHFVAERIFKYYGRTATVVYPPIDLQRFQNQPAQDFYLTAGRLVDYKRFDLVIEACNRLKRKLIVVGDGPEFNRLKQLAGPTVTMAGRLPDATLTDLMQTCRAFIFAGVEDFGMVMAEAQAAGKPVIAYAAGGAQDIIHPEGTGLAVKNQTGPAFMEALLEFEKQQWDVATIRLSAQRFSTERFLDCFREFITSGTPS